MRIDRKFMQEFVARLPEPALPSVYADVLARVRVRHVPLPGRSGKLRIMKTLLGYEALVGTWRKSCPDEHTARFLGIVGSVGCRVAYVPYNPLDARRALPALDRAMQDVEACIDSCIGAQVTPQRRKVLRRRILRKLTGYLESAPAADVVAESVAKRAR